MARNIQNEAEEVQDAIFFNITPKMSWVWFVIQSSNNGERLCFFLILSSVCAAKIIEAACRRATGNFVAAWSSWKLPDRKCTFLPHNFSLYPTVSLDLTVTVFAQEFNLSRRSSLPVVQAKTGWAVNFTSCYCSVLPTWFLLLSIFLFSRAWFHHLWFYQTYKCQRGDF